MPQKSRTAGDDHYHPTHGAEWPHPCWLQPCLPPWPPAGPTHSPCSALPARRGTPGPLPPQGVVALGPWVRHLSRVNWHGIPCFSSAQPWPARPGTREGSPHSGTSLSSSQPHSGSCGAPRPWPSSGRAVTARLAGIPSEYFILHNITTQRCCSCTASA